MDSSYPVAGIGPGFGVSAPSGLADIAFHFWNPEFREENEEER